MRFIKTIKDGFIYLTSEVIVKFFPFILLPILAKVIPLFEMGLLTNYLVVFNICVSLIAFNGFSFLSVTFYENNASNRLNIVRNLILLQISITAIIIIISSLTHGIIFKLTGIQYELQLIAIFSALFSSIITLKLTLSRLEEKPTEYFLIQVTQSLLIFLGTIVLLEVYSDWYSRVYAAFFSYLTISIFLFRKEIINLEFSFDRSIYIKSFFFGLPLIPHALSMWIKTSADKLILTNIDGMESNAIFSIALSFGILINVLIIAIFNLYSPWFYKIQTPHIKRNKNKTVDKKIIYSIVLIIPSLGLISIIGYQIIKIIFPLLYEGDYLQSIDYLPLVFFLSYSSIFYSIFSLFLFHIRKTKILGIITFSSSILQILLSFFLGEKLGIKGILYSGIITSFITAFAIFYCVLNFYSLKPEK
jgi:O-antigen/teichoic acid export membrane protein